MKSQFKPKLIVSTLKSIRSCFQHPKKKGNLTVTVIVLHSSTMALDTELIYLKLHRVDCMLIKTCRNHCTYNAFMASVAGSK